MTTPSMIDAPAGWRAERIGNLFSSWGGMTPAKGNKSYWGSGIAWVSSRDVKAARQTGSTHTLTKEAVEATGLRVCPPGSVLVVMRSGILAHSLPVAVTEVPVVINQDLKAFHSDEPLMNEWLALFLRLSADQLLASSRRDGTTVQSIQYPLLKDAMMPVPPLEERRRIIEAVDHAFIKQDSARPRVAAARRAIERFRRAVLAAACSGRLTAVWRSERALPNGKEPAGWRVITVSDIGEVQLGGTPSRKVPSYWGGDIPWVSSGEVANCRIGTTRETISVEGLSHSSAKLYPKGTVLIAMIGEGKTRGQASILDIEAATNQNAAGIIPDRNVVDPEFLWRWALAQYENTRAVGRGGNQPALNKQKVRELVIALPPLQEQREIVRRIDRILESERVIVQRLDTATRRIDRSSQAVLAKAFRGELTSRAPS